MYILRRRSLKLNKELFCFFFFEKVTPELFAILTWNFIPFHQFCMNRGKTTNLSNSVLWKLVQILQTNIARFSTYFLVSEYSINLKLSLAIFLTRKRSGDVSLNFICGNYIQKQSPRVALWRRCSLTC